MGCDAVKSGKLMFAKKKYRKKSRSKSRGKKYYKELAEKYGTRKRYRRRKKSRSKSRRWSSEDDCYGSSTSYTEDSVDSLYKKKNNKKINNYCKTVCFPMRSNV